MFSFCCCQFEDRVLIIIINRVGKTPTWWSKKKKKHSSVFRSTMLPTFNVRRVVEGSVYPDIRIIRQDKSLVMGFEKKFQYPTISRRRHLLSVQRYSPISRSKSAPVPLDYRDNSWNPKTLVSPVDSILVQPTFFYLLLFFFVPKKNISPFPGIIVQKI